MKKTKKYPLYYCFSSAPNGMIEVQPPSGPSFVCSADRAAKFGYTMQGMDRTAPNPSGAGTDFSSVGMSRGTILNASGGI